jgi:hypothetical protein
LSSSTICCVLLYRSRAERMCLLKACMILYFYLCSIIATFNIWRGSGECSCGVHFQLPMQSICSYLKTCLFHAPQFLISSVISKGASEARILTTLVFSYWREGATPLQTTRVCPKLPGAVTQGEHTRAASSTRIHDRLRTGGIFQG